ncbi:MAG: asparagine synthase-related protein, partial [Acidobacteriota bacterium]
RDILTTKIPRALRFNDRISMIASTELREPFLDHRLVELAFRQPAHRKIRGDTGKAFLRAAVADFFPQQVSEAPKRPLQTPQREWLRGPLRDWANEQIEAMLDGPGGHWFHADRIRAAWQGYQAGNSDNSFYVWQWLSLAMLQERFE